MTKVTVKYIDNEIVSISAEGHAMFRVRGKDIVCAAISTLMSTAVNALEAVAGIDLFPCEIDEKSAYWYIELPTGLDEMKKLKANVILETVLQGLQGVANAYPKNMKLHKKGGANIQ
jgi:hypothetical protein